MVFAKQAVEVVEGRQRVSDEIANISTLATESLEEHVKALVGFG